LDEAEENTALEALIAEVQSKSCLELLAVLLLSNTSYTPDRTISAPDLN